MAITCRRMMNLGTSRSDAAHRPDKALAALQPAGAFCALLATLILTFTTPAQELTAIRQLPFDFHPGDRVQGTVVITPPSGTTNWSHIELYPPSWDFISTTNSSATNIGPGILSFGPFKDDAVRTLTYEIGSIHDLTNSAVFDGHTIFNGSTNITAGTRHLPARTDWVFAGPQSLPGNHSVSGVAHGAGRWVASKQGWTTTIEPSGRLTYPRVFLPHSEGLSRLAFSGGLFIHFGAGRKPLLSVSTDGLHWTNAQKEESDPQMDPFNIEGAVLSVAYGNNTFVAVGVHRYENESHLPQRGAIWRSANGYNWRRVFTLPLDDTNPSTRAIHAVAFGDNRFMAVADRGTLLTSTDGSNWSVVQPITAPGDFQNEWMNRSLRGVCYGPEGWLIPTSVSGAVLRSSNGEEWSVLTGTGSGNGLYWQSFFADGKYWFSSYNDAYSTQDGSSWTRLISQSATHPLGPISRALDGTTPLYLGAGYLPYHLVSSDDGSAWKSFSMAALGGWPWYLSVAAFSNNWVVAGISTLPGRYPDQGGFLPNDRLGMIWFPRIDNAGGAVGVYTKDANAHWHFDPASNAWADLLATPTGVIGVGGWIDQRTGGDLFAGRVYMGHEYRKRLPALQRSIYPLAYKGMNNAQFQFVNASITPHPSGFDTYVEAYTGGGIGNVPVLLWGHFNSPDGTNWSRRANGLNNVTNFPGIQSLAWGAGRFIAASIGQTSGGEGTLTSTNRLYTSVDGEDYEPVDLSGVTPPLQSEGLTGIAYGSGRFVAIGNRGRLLTSTNGLNWQSVRDSIGPRWNRVRNLNGIWAVVGSEGHVAFSPDGLTWFSKTAGADAELLDIALNSGHFMVVGTHAMALLTMPLVSPAIPSESLQTTPAGGLQFTVTGQAGKVVAVQSSPDLLNWSGFTYQTNENGQIRVTTSSTSSEQKFYRAIQLP
jgi:hypothetical protein